MSIAVACVLRRSPLYDAEYVDRLRFGVSKHLPGVPFVCLSDVSVPCDRISLAHNWPGWWAKMEMFRPDIRGDLLYFDLDTAIVGDLREIAAFRRLAMLDNFYHPGDLGSGMMMLPEACRGDIWDAWIKDPDKAMEECGVYGDQLFLQKRWIGKAARWQHEFPGKVLSYKVHVRHPVNKRDVGNGTIPVDASVICFHGNPRLRDLDWLGREFEPRAAMMSRRLPRDLGDRPVFIVGGGPSASEIDLNRLRGEGYVVAVNDSMRKIPWADAVFTADCSWLRQRRNELLNFQGACIAAIPSGFLVPHELTEKAEVVKRLEGVDLSSDPDAVYYAENSGFGALDFVAGRGAVRIVLIGFDMNGPGHWHGGYEWRCRFGTADYPRWASYFDRIAPKLRHRGIDVVNVNLNSAIRKFRFAGLDEILRIAA